MTTTKLLCPSSGKGYILAPKSPIKAHQIDQRNVLNAKMYVAGAKNHFFFSRVKSSENWPKLAGRISSSGGGGSRAGDPPPPPHYIHPWLVR